MDSRARLVASAAKRWQDALVDDSGRNQLAYYRDLKVGTLNLDNAKPAQLTQLLAGRPVALRHLFAQPEAHADAMKRMRAVRKHMRMWQEERGVDVGYLVRGLASWAEVGRTPRSPVLLQRLSVKPSSALHTDFILDTDPEPSINPVLLHKLEKDHGLVIKPEDLEDREPEDLFGYLSKLAADVPGFTIERTNLIGTFTYAKLPMVDDIGDAVDVLSGHDVIAALAGDKQSLTMLATQTGITADAPDHVDPADEHLVLDADSSQSHAINAVIAGQHLVIKGPPGTGKSQTIANMIAALAARGRTTLFVAEKRAAIDAVVDRLRHIGLDDLVHNLHGEQQSRRELARSLEARLQRARTEAEPETRANDRRLLQSRHALARHHDAMHEPRQPWGFSVFHIQSGLAGLPPTPWRWSGEQLRALHGSAADKVREAVAELAHLPRQSAWTGTTISDRATAQTAFALARQAAAQWPQACDAVARLNAELSVIPADGVVQRSAMNHTVATNTASPEAPAQAPIAGGFDVAAMQMVVQLAGDVSYTLQRMRPECFQADLSAWDGFFPRRRTAKLMRSMWIGTGRPSKATLHKAALAIADQKARWARLTTDGQPPRAARCLPEAQSSLSAALDTLRKLHAYLPVDDLPSKLDSLAGDQRGLLDAVRRNELTAALKPWRADGLASADEFDYAWLHSILDEIRFSDDHLARFQGSALHATAEQFRASDGEHIMLAAARVRHKAALHMIRVLDEQPEQQRLVRSEAAKKTRHLPVRKLFEQAPQALTALKPCWAMSPLLASQVLPARVLFDVVIFDEASQVEPVDAITSIMRGRQVVVAGDEHQLPPTAFFNRVVVDDDEPDFDDERPLTDDIESLLQSFANALPLTQIKHLSWHYRSRDERLIAFSNRHIYAPNGNELVTFPGADTGDCLTYVPATGSEVDTVVALMLEHARKRPNESLGVITMGIKHADQIDNALHKALASLPDLAPFFTEAGLEPYFVKNIERVQGDERDAIIMSVGYTKAADGRMRYLLGPLNIKGGERRLNVAVTRAKHRLTLVSSFSFTDMDPHRLKADGARLLRSYLEYVQVGGQNRTRLGGTPQINAFEADVRDRLAEAGVPMLPKYGVSGYRVDFAAHRPDRPERMVMAVETDGDTYHASPTVRDRDRLRQQHLERLGWRFHRIWLSDWFTDRDREVARAVEAFDAALDPVEPRPLGQSPSPNEPPPAVKMRGPRPELPEYKTITDLPDHVLAELVKWVESDGLNRTEEEVVSETVAELGFTRRGSRIVDAVKRARHLTR